MSFWRFTSPGIATGRFKTGSEIKIFLNFLNEMYNQELLVTLVLGIGLRLLELGLVSPFRLKVGVGVRTEVTQT